MIFKYRLFLCLFLSWQTSFSQQSIPEFGIEETVHYGSILPHRPIVTEIIEGHSFIYEVSFYKNTTGNKAWQQLFNYPKIGISAMYINLGNDDELGSSFGIFPYIQIPLSKQKIRWELRFGYGFGYVEKPFDRADNYKNIAIGSRFNTLINVNSLWKIQASKHIAFSAGISLVHFSNGSYVRPNLGFNVFSLNTGVSYSFGKDKEIQTTTLPNKEKTWEHFIVGNTGLKEIPPVEGPKYYIANIAYNMVKPINNTTSFGFSADIFYNKSIEALIEYNDNIEASKTDNLRTGLGAMYGINIGNIMLSLHMGGYILPSYKEDGYFYHRINSRYKINDNLFFNLGLKSHWAVADFIEVGLGFRIK